MFLQATGAVLLGVAGYCYYNKKPKVIGLKPLSWYEYIQDLYTSMTTNPTAINISIREKRGDIYLYMVFGFEFVGVAGKEMIDFIADQERLGNIANKWIPSTRSMLGKVMSTTDGELHAKLRKVNAGAFRPSALNSYIPKIERLIRDLMCKQIEEHVDFHSVTKNIITSIVFECLFGVPDVLSPEFQKELKKWNQDFIGFSGGLFTIPINLPGFPFYRGMKARTAMVNHLIPLLRKQKQEYEDSGRNPALKTSFMTLMETPMSDSEYLTEFEMGEQALLLYFAGHDTTASFLTNIFKQLELHPLIFEKAKQEQLHLFPFDRPFSSQDLLEMPYLDACIKEVLRKDIVVPGVFKETLKDIVYNDIVIPKGTPISINLAGTFYRYNEHIAPPEQFEPLRFLEDGNDYFIPFGIGRHTCLGKNLFMLEVKMILSLFLRKYTWKEIGQSTHEYFPINTRKNLIFDFIPVE